MGVGLELDQQIDIAVWPRRSLKLRAEQRQTANPVFLAKPGEDRLIERIVIRASLNKASA